MIVSEEELERLRDKVLDPHTSREDFDDALKRIRELERMKPSAR